MTAIACGGGPTLQQRRGFASLRDGTHVPGYKGYCPQIKYRIGKTYGTDTHELAQTQDHVQPVQSVNAVSGVQVNSILPKSTGDNKYTDEMMPGYTGYIPRKLYRFGGRYKAECDACIDECMTNKQNHELLQADLWRQVTAMPRLTAISHDPHVRDHLDKYRDTHPTKSMLMEERRPLTEPPIPGYNGYIPRIKSTDLGLGHRYHVACGNGFRQFLQETTRHAENLGHALPKALERIPYEHFQSATPLYTRRLYQTDGMLPKYTGYIPKRRFIFGNTYGDTTRSLDVCGHKSTSYGEYLRSQDGNKQ